jgi:seryl-tRNA synthetase
MQQDEAMVASLQAAVSARDLKIQELQDTLVLRDTELTVLQDQVEHASRERDALQEALSRAVSRYRDLVVAAHPDVPQELIRGDSLEEIDASLESARALVEKVKQQLNQQAQPPEETTVPAGAPPRSGPDISSMTPREKIQYGLTRS